MIAENKIDGKLEIKLKDPITKAITIRIIYAIRLVSNSKEYWKYVRYNGKKLGKISPLNPQLWAEEIGKEYARRGIDGQIKWQYSQKNHTQNEKMVPEEILGSV